jgi:hypothetical protein
MPVPAFWIVPPLPAEPVPLTVNPPLEPVLLSTMPLAAPFAEMLRNLRPEAPIVAFATLSAVPAVVVNVLAVFVADTVPPPVALKAAFVPVLSVKAPVKEIVEPVLLVRSTPFPLFVVIVPL